MSRALPAVLYASSLLLAGCFVYSPAETRNTPAGKQIEVTLNREGSRAYDRELGSDAYLVTGTLYGDENGAIQMRLMRVRRRDGRDYPGAGQMVFIDHGHVISVQERRVSSPRTWAASVTGIAAFAFLNRWR